MLVIFCIDYFIAVDCIDEMYVFSSRFNYVCYVDV